MAVNLREVRTSRYPSIRRGEDWKFLSQEAKQRLVEKHTPLVIKTLNDVARLMEYRKKRQLVSEDEDLFQTGLLGSIEAFTSFDPKKGKISTHIAWSVIRTAKRFIKGEKRKGFTSDHAPVKHSVGRNEEIPVRSLSETVKFDNLGKPVQLGECIADPVSVEEVTERKLVVDGAISRLSEKEQKIIRLWFFEDMPVREIGKIMGFSWQRAEQILQRACTKLKTIPELRELLPGNGISGTEESKNIVGVETATGTPKKKRRRRHMVMLLHPNQGGTNRNESYKPTRPIQVFPPPPVK